MTSRHSLGKTLKSFREAKDLTQSELAQKAGIHPNTLAKIERDLQTPTFATIKKIAKVLDVDIASLPE